MKSSWMMCLAAGLLGMLHHQTMAQVQSRTEELKLPAWTSKANWEVDAKHPKPHSMAAGTKKQVEDRVLQTQVLENEYLKVQVVPELGGVVARAVYKPTGDDLFFFEGKVKNWLPWWESGVKVSFPYYEHGLGSEQPAGYRVLRNDDGSVTLAMWMEFSRFDEAFQRKRYGRFSTMLLSQMVTLRPGQSTFSVTYRIVNPGPWKQGRRLWADTLLPRNQTRDGVVQGEAVPPLVTSTQWVYPAAYSSDHGGMGLGKYDPSLSTISNRKGGSYSVFAWDIPYGFAGLYYPEVAVNRLRLFDPQVAPGAKQWFIGEGGWVPAKPNHMYNFCELWGGSDDVFEGVEDWIRPGESYQFTYHFTLVKGLGKVEWADAGLALQTDFSAQPPTINVVTLRPHAKLTATLDDKVLGEQVGSPDRVASFTAPTGAKGGRLVLAADGATLFDRDVPVTIPDRTAKHDAIKAALKGSATRDEMMGNADEQGHTYQTAIGGYPAGSADKGRVLLRDGQLAAAVEHLTKASAAGEDEATYLLGMAQLEQGDVKRARVSLEKAAEKLPATRYYLAVLDMADGKPDAARRQLAELVKANPAHFEARLLLATIEADAKALAGLEQEDPADPRVQFAIVKCAGGADRSALDGLLREPGAKRRVDEFEKLISGRYTAPARLKNQ